LNSEKYGCYLSKKMASVLLTITTRKEFKKQRQLAGKVPLLFIKKPVSIKVPVYPYKATPYIIRWFYL
jgi:hypothetical protein